MTKIQLTQVEIRRDAQTITSVTVAPYEITLLKAMFGKENVQTIGEGHVIEVDAAGEHERLSAKYGAEKVSKVFGDDDGARLAEMVEKAEYKDGKKAVTKEVKAETV